MMEKTNKIAHRPVGTTWDFKILHALGLVVTFPVIVAARLLPRHWHELHDESVFVETNRTVLTALGFAYMA